jgi:transposase-like protein
LLWGDICGYVWGKSNSRIEIPITYDKQRQSYYGAINYKTGKVMLKEYPQENTENTIKFVKDLREQNQEKKLVIIWDGASYGILQVNLVQSSE